MNLISDEQYNKLVKSGREYIENHGDGKMKSIDPIVTIVMRDRGGADKYDHIVVLFEEFDGDKRKIMRKLGQKAMTDGQAGMLPVAISLISEAWIAEVSHEKELKGKAVRDYANKKEVAMLAAMKLNGDTDLYHYPIGRDRRGKIVLGKAKNCPETEANLLRAFFEGVADIAL